MADILHVDITTGKVFTNRWLEYVAEHANANDHEERQMMHWIRHQAHASGSRTEQTDPLAEYCRKVNENPRIKRQLTVQEAKLMIKMFKEEKSLRSIARAVSRDFEFVKHHLEKLMSITGGKSIG